MKSFFVHYEGYGKNDVDMTGINNGTAESGNGEPPTGVEAKITGIYQAL